MLFQYKKFRIKNGIKESTVKVELTLIRNFNAFLNSKYKKHLEYYEIRPSDLREFLDEIAKVNKDATLSRKLSIFRNWFDYLWQEKKIPLDFMPKFNYRELIKEPEREILNYETLMEKRSLVYNSSISLMTKLMFMLFMKGIRLRDLIEIKVDGLKDDGDSLQLNVSTKNDLLMQIEIKDHVEVAILINGREQAIFRGVDYLVSSKRKGIYTQYQIGTLSDMMEQIESLIEMPFRGEKVRNSLLAYLVNKNGYSVEDIVEYFGVPLMTASTMKKRVLETKDSPLYNKKKTS